MKRDGQLASLWQGTTAIAYIPNNKNIDLHQLFDVVVIGAGITGITTALELQRAGKKVLVLEAQSIGFGTTCGTTAHLNTFVDTTYAQIASNFSEQASHNMAKAIQQANAYIENNIKQLAINCSYTHQPGYLYSQNDQQDKELTNIIKSSLEAGVAVEESMSIPIPIPFQSAAVFAWQASFHPIRYLYSLASEFERLGGIIMEQSRVTDIAANEQLEIALSSSRKIKAGYALYATHIPPGVNLLHFRCAPYRSYAIAVQLEDDAYPDGLIYDMYDPYHYFRTQEIDGERYLIAGGEDHKTGHETNTENCFRNLESFVRRYFKVKQVVFNWSSQYYEPADGLPYIGRLPGNDDRILVATGFSGNGFIYSAIAANIIADLLTQKENPLIELLNPNRIKPVAGFTNVIKESADVTMQLIKSLFPAEQLQQLSDLATGEAKIIKHEKQQMAAFKDANGQLHTVNPVCTHIKCTVAWNNAEQSWDCPCHGARYNCEGEVLTGPAVKNLEKLDWQA